MITESQRAYAPRSGPSRVLFVDDDTSLLDIVTRFLERKGYAVETAEDVASALTRLAQADNAYDVIITAIDMPGLDGVEFIRTLRAAEFKGRIMAYTGDLSPQRKAELSQLRVDAALQKGNSVEALVETVASLTGSAT